MTETKTAKKKTKTPKSKKTENTAKLKKELEQLKKQNLLLQDQLLRKAAEFENYKKRTQREIRDVVAYANENLIVSILPVIDDLERSLDSQKDENGVFYEGIKLIYNKLMKTLEEKGLKKIDAVGKEFDVDKHEAILQMKSKKSKKNHVIEEYEKGYELNGKVIRHSKVVVSE